MSARKTISPQPDLVAYRCSQLTAFATLSLDPATIESLREIVRASRKIETWPWEFSESYRVKGEWHTATAQMSPGKQTGTVDLQLELSPSGPSRKRLPTVWALLEAMSESDRTVDVQCGGDFEYAEDDGVSTIPLPLLGADAAPPRERSVGRIEVRGLRLTKLDAEGSIDYSLVMDRPFNASWSISVTFRRSSMISPALPSELFARLVEIAESVFKVQQRSVPAKPAG